MAASDGLWKEVLHNFSRYFVLLVVGPALLLVAWYFHTQGLELWRNGVAALAAILIIASFSSDPSLLPTTRRSRRRWTTRSRPICSVIWRVCCRTCAAAARRCLSKVGADATFCVLRRFPLETELAGRELMAQPARDDRPRITPQGFTALIFEAGSLLEL